MAMVEGARVEGTRVEGIMPGIAMGCTVCKRCAWVRASRCEANAGSASLARSQTLLEAIHICLVFSVMESYSGLAIEM